MWPFIFYCYMKADPNSILNNDNFANHKNDNFNFDNIDINQLD